MKENCKAYAAQTRGQSAQVTSLCVAFLSMVNEKKKEEGKEGGAKELQFVQVQFIWQLRFQCGQKTDLAQRVSCKLSARRQAKEILFLFRTDS